MMAVPARALARRTANPEFAAHVAEGLGARRQKFLHARWLYDQVGSALFEAITVLPEYGLTRADERLIAAAAGQMIRAAGNPNVIIELGSGTGAKTLHLLEAARANGGIRYFAIDVSGAALLNCAKTLGGLPAVEVEPIESSYVSGIEVALARRRAGERVLVLFLGSTIGNFGRTDARVFLRDVRRRLRPGDGLLLGADLLKPRKVLIDAYNDATGVTAAFNLNLLARINRELGGRFDLRCFGHEARFNERFARVEMHLRSRIAHKVAIEDLSMSVSFRAGETIWTESSHKFRAEEVISLGRRAGFTGARQWIDRAWGFAETLFSAG